MAVNIRALLLIENDGTSVGANEDLIATRPWRVYDQHCVVVTPGVTTTSPQRQAAGAGLFDAMLAGPATYTDNAAAGTLLRAGAGGQTLVDAELGFVATDVFRIAYSGAGRQAVYTAIIPRPIPGA